MDRQAPDSPPSPAEGDGLRFLRIALAILSAGVSCYGILLFLVAPEQSYRALGPLLLLPVALAAFLLLRGDRTAAALRVLVFGVWAAVTIAAFFAGGVRAPSLAAYPLLIVMAGWLLGLRSGIVLAGLCLAAGALFALAETAGFLPPTSPAPTLLLWFVQGLVYLTAAVLIAFVLHRYQARFGQVRKLGEELAEEHAFLETLMNTQSDAGQAILIVESGRIAFANEAAGGLFGYGRNELLALPGFLELVHPDDRERLSRNYRRRLRGERFENKYRVSILTRSGERRETELTAARMPGEAPRVLCVFADITEQEGATRALREQHALYETLLRAQSDAGLGMCIVEGNRIVFANDAFCGLFGMSRQEIEALPSYATLLHPDDRERVRSNYERRLRGEQFENRYRIAIVTQAGERREAEMTVVYISTPTPRVLIIIKDVTDSVRAEAARQHAEEEVRHLNADLERRVQERTAELTAANRELESFAYSISHDLRAPLRGIDGFSQLLADEYRERLDAQGVDYLERVRRAAQRMGHLIDDILELSRVTRQEMRRVRVDLSQIAAELIEELARAAPAHRVETHLAPGLTAQGDPQLLRVLMQNLVENAWKYSAKETAPRIEFGQERHDEETVFFVRDNGVGFDMQFAGRLFTPFQRLHRPEEFEGTGIGLATVARIAHRHGGRAWIESEPGKGTTVRFTLPGA
ncbi:MAG: Adaptive-response sensory-kinase SasA [Rhodocyclaceae bacterium]|nr:Adaptive-response sensory-kinase SasA [Rhodocyclaceae bacterium]